MIPCLLILLTGCATERVVVEYETAEVFVDRYVPVPESLTKPVDIVDLPENPDTITLGSAYKTQKTRARQCNGQLEAIRNLAKEE